MCILGAAPFAACGFFTYHGMTCLLYTSNLPQIKAERMPQDFSVVLPKLWRKRQAWDAERTKRPPYRGEER